MTRCVSLLLSMLIAPSAGVKDSALTVHGSLQAERLGKHIAKNELKLTHIFSSDLQRAVKTAGAIRSWNEAAHPGAKLEVTTLKVLREQDFGYYEGKPFYARPRESNKSGKENHLTQHQDDPDFKDVESKESMAARMKDFLHDHLIPLIRNQSTSSKSAIAIVSHGIILSQLWRAFLHLLSKDSVRLSPEVSMGSGKTTPLEYLGGWSNTGYLELEIHRKAEVASQAGSATAQKLGTGPPPESVTCLHDCTVTVKTVNGKAHLQGLKRTKGGVGSAAFDKGQKSIDSFFKKRKSAASPD